MPWRLGLGAVLILFMSPLLAFAAEAEHHAAPLRGLPIWTIIPFVGMLLSIAFLPLFAEHFWHSNRNRLIVSMLFALPIIAYLFYLEEVFLQPGFPALLESLHEYIAFICLLGSLYIVSGGIVLDLNVRPSPLVNGAILAIGSILANIIGTTGASMLLIRPYLRINKTRTHTNHLPIFFIFIVSNLGGLLTPLGDPPLFLGFLRGVNFFWTFNLWKEWLIANLVVLVVFLVWDIMNYKKDPNLHKLTPPPSETGKVFRVRGVLNFLFLLGILLAVLMNSRQVTQPINDWLTGMLGQEVDITFHSPMGEILMVAMGLLSLYFTPGKLRQINEFGWGAILEVAVLFLGIFITMVPALALLKEHGGGFGITKPWQYFWLTGSLSAFLDNAPTYLTFVSLASSGAPEGVPVGRWLMENGPELLQAISCGAVFMGAMTYIGNGPNFMVKAIADENNYRTPSFFGYLAYSALILLPTFLILTFLFFVPATALPGQ